MAAQTIGKRKKPKPKAEMKTSAEIALAVAERRIAGMEQIAAASRQKTLDLGGGVTTGAVTTARDALSELVKQQADLATQVNRMRMQVRAQVKVVQTFNKRVLQLARGRYGDDSQEYKQVGGTPRSQYRKPVRKARTGAAAEPTSAQPAQPGASVPTGQPSSAPGAGEVADLLVAAKAGGGVGLHNGHHGA